MNPVVNRLATHRGITLHGCVGLLAALVLGLAVVAMPAHMSPVALWPAADGVGAGNVTDVGGVGGVDGGVDGVAVSGTAGAGWADGAAQAAARVGEGGFAGEKVVVDKLNLAKQDSVGDPAPGNLVAHSSSALLTFRWRVQAESLAAGDAFSLELPEQLKFKESETQPLHALLGEVAPIEVGSCALSATTMTCTFNEVLPARIAAGYTDPHGTGRVQLTPVAPTTRTALSFVSNGHHTHRVDLPAHGGITKRDTP